MLLLGPFADEFNCVHVCNFRTGLFPHIAVKHKAQSPCTANPVPCVGGFSRHRIAGIGGAGNHETFAFFLLYGTASGSFCHSWSQGRAASRMPIGISGVND